MWIDKGDRSVEPQEGKRVAGLWREHVNSETGESSYREHTLSTIATYCRPKDHYFEASSPSSREVVCKKCGFISSYILGLQILQDGKIIDRVKVSA